MCGVWCSCQDSKLHRTALQMKTTLCIWSLPRSSRTPHNVLWTHEAEVELFRTLDHFVDCLSAPWEHQLHTVEAASWFRALLPGQPHISQGLKRSTDLSKSVTGQYQGVCPSPGDQHKMQEMQQDDDPNIQLWMWMTSDSPPIGVRAQMMYNELKKTNRHPVNISKEKKTRSKVPPEL